MELQAVADDVRHGKPRQTTPRMLISWFGAKRRGYLVNETTREALKSVGLQTNPDFEYAYIDEDVLFEPIPPATNGHGAVQAERASVEAPTTRPTTSTPAARETQSSPDPTYRIGKLEAAHRPLTTVNPEDSVTKAITLMMANDFSQLPVMSGERNLKGLVSWESIAQTIHFKSCTKVSDCMIQPNVVSSDT